VVTELEEFYAGTGHGNWDSSLKLLGRLRERKYTEVEEQQSLSQLPS